MDQNIGYAFQHRNEKNYTTDVRKSIPGYALIFSINLYMTDIRPTYKNSLNYRVIQLKLEIIAWIRAWVIVLVGNIQQIAGMYFIIVNVFTRRC